MSNRQPRYLIGLFLLALILSSPQLLIGVLFLQNMSRIGIQQTFGMLGQVNTYSQLSHAVLWQDRFLYLSRLDAVPGGGFTPVLHERDPETGSVNDAEIVFGKTWNGGHQPMMFGDQLWIWGNTESIEVVNGVARQHAAGSFPSWVGEGHRFLMDGKPAGLTRNRNGFVVSTIVSKVWTSAFDVVLPDFSRTWTIDQTPVSFRSSAMGCFNQGDRIHCVFNANGHLLYREGLVLRPIAKPGADLSTEPVSALQAENSDFAIAGWKLVRKAPVVGYQGPQCGMLVEGRPAVLIADAMATGSLVGHVYRLDEDSWTEIATVQFPFGCNQFRTVCCRDGQRSYIVATTATGRAHVYSVSGAGVQQTLVDPAEWSAGWNWLRRWLSFPSLALILGASLGTATWAMMRRFTTPEYGFGHQSMKLASLGKRGLARLIDLAVILLSTAALAWVMTLGFDWQSLAEAIQLGVDHPTVPVAIRTGILLLLWLAVVTSALVFVQGRWGLTPGKWCCGLRTWRATLTPCGFARSLTRELLLSVDALHLLCWTPGILSIALTDHRQRLGDLVADTVVVEFHAATGEP